MNLVPLGWQQLELSEVATVQTGIAKGAKTVNDPVELPYLRVANVQDGFLDLTEIKTILIDRHQINRYLLRVGDVLLTEGGDFDKLGRGTVWNGQIENCVHQNHVFVVRTDPATLLPHFFSALASSPYGKQYFLSCAKQTTNLASINSTQLKAFPVLLPTLSEQRKIAEILSTWDEAIDLTAQLMAAKQRRKQALMQRLLTGQVRFPKFALSKVNLGENSLPAEWKTDVLANVAIFLDEQRKPIKQNDREKIHGIIPYYGASGIIDYVDDYIFDDELILLGEDGANILTRSTRLVFRVSGKCWVNNHAHVIKPKSNMDIDYLCEYLESLSYTQYNTGTAQPKLTKETCQSIRVVVPPLEEQIKISSVLRLCDEEIDLLQQKLTALRRQKQGLMQQLLTGKVRVQA